MASRELKCALFLGVLFLFVGLGIGFGQGATGTGVITGSVRGADGHPLANALVVVAFRPTKVGEAPVNFAAYLTTAADGTYVVSKVPSGKFAICPSFPGSNLLPACMWGSEPTVTVVSGQTATAPPIQMSAGVDLYVRVNDPNGKLTAPSPGLMLGVRLPKGITVPIPKMASDSGGADYHLYVPATALELIAFSATHSMSDAQGSAIDPQAGYLVPFTIPTGTPQHKETIAIR